MQIPPSQSAATLLRSSINAPRFTSGCSALDSLFSAPSTSTSQSQPQPQPGLPKHTVLELMGPPGSGKTRTALGFALAARFDALENERDGDVLVIDAEGSLSSQLIYATAVLYANHHGHDNPDTTVLQVCQGIHYKRVHSVALLVAFFHTLPRWLAQHPRVNLILIDSLTSHVRPTTLDMSTKAMVLQLIKATLTQITASPLSVVVTTQLTLKLFSPITGEPVSFTRDAEALLIPPLGDSWIGGKSVRVILYFNTNGERLAYQMPSRHGLTSPDPVGFTMDDLGPCDYPEPESQLEEDEEESFSPPPSSDPYGLQQDFDMESSSPP